MAKENEHGHCCCCGGKGHFWGLALLIAGVLFLARDLGYIAGISFWTILLLVLGVFMVLSGKCKH